MKRAFGLMAFVAATSVPAVAQDAAMYLDTALKDGYAIKGQSSVVFTRTIDGVLTQFSRVEVIVQKDNMFALCSIETNIEKRSSTEQACASFK